MGKLGAVLFCLVFLVTFGVVGVGASWAIASTIRDAVRAQDWVKVRASVDPLPAERYRYAYQGREYTGTRLGTFAMGGSDDLDDWSERLATYLSEARDSGKPIMVYVNPGNPAEALIDRDIRWKLLVFMSPFAFVFGGVALGALYAMVRILKASKPNDSRVATRDKRLVAASGDGSLASLWIFALFWNGLSWPVAILAVPEMLRDENWIGLFVLLFPFFGLIFLWAAIRMSLARLSGGKATLKLQTEDPRAGAALSGSVIFAKRFSPGTPMRLRLLCMRVEGGSDSASTRPQWHKEQVVPVGEGPEGSQVAFHFDIPADAHATPAGSTARVRYRWRLEVNPARQVASVPHGFDIEVAAPAFATAREAAAVPDTPEFQTIEKLLGDRGMGPLSAEQKGALAKMTPEQQAQVAKVAAWAPSGKKLVIMIVAFFIAGQFVPLLLRWLVSR